MAKTKIPKRRSSAVVAEERVRTLKARLETAQLKAALSYYSAADKGRRNKDWRPNAASADLALIPEQGTVVARSRMAIANTWVGKAAYRAQKRNVVGRGVETVPTATDAKGKDATDLNEAVTKDFGKWAGDQSAVDVEGRRTWWQFQRCIVGEEFAAGEGFLIWSYEPHPRRCGLKLQLVEHEQLDQSKQREGNNEVRGGIEVDENGRPVAYWFYQRNPNDIYSSTKLESVRVPASRVLHYYDAERSQQSHGEPRLAPVLSDIRNLYALHDATLWRARMEACIGLVITRNSPTGSGFGPTTPYAPGNTGVAPSGSRTADFRPGMVFEAQPGETVSNTGLMTPGSTYAPFTEQCLRGIGAGVGMSFGALTRHNDGNYSAARQDMLEDEREISPQQDLLIDRIVLPVYELWYTMAVAEGRFADHLDPADFYADPDRYMESEYVTPVRPWIDPANEVQAYEKALKLHISTRSEIIAMKGGRFQNVMKQRKAERDIAKTLEITFTEDADITSVRSDAAAQFAKADSDRASAEATRKPPAPPPPVETPSIPAATASGGVADAAPIGDAEKAAAVELALNGAQITSAVDVIVKVRQGVLVPDVAKELLVAVGIPRETAVKMVDDTAGQPELPTAADSMAVESLAAIGMARAEAHSIVAQRLAARAAPGYRTESTASQSCATCANAVGMACKRFDFNFSPDHVCDAWEAPALSEMGGSGSIQGTQRADGEPAFEDTSARDGR